MSNDELEQLVSRLLEEICFDDPSRIQSELQTFGDAEIPSIYFLEILGALEEELNIKIPEYQVINDIHKKVKSSFRSFCALINSILGGAVHGNH
jgi:acyl carrier protein